MPLSIIIVNYRSAQLILDCLERVYRDSCAADFEVIILDNASGDDSERRILSAYPGVRWIQMNYNAGFARANNEGIRRSSGEIVLLLNGDTLPEDQAIGKCYRQLADSEYIAAGVQLMNEDRTPQIAGNFFMKGGLNYLLPLPYLGVCVKWAGSLLHVAKPNVPDAHSLVEVDWINGAFIMVKRTAIAKAGMMDEDFFLYAEEAEWCGRLRKTGKLCIFGSLKVIHLQGASTNEAFGSSGKGYYNLYDRKGLQIMLSNFVRIRKQFGVGWFLLQWAFYLLEIPVFFIGMILSRPFTPAGKGYSFTQFRQYCKNIGIVTGKSLIIIRNKPYFYKVL